jgi:pyridoxal phosphate enzyme (YggS family)
MSIADNLHRVQERIARAAESAGRSASEITLVGVTKYVDSQAATELVAAGCTELGESRPQELWKKAGEVASATVQSRIHWHFIGHLQRNKVARTLPLVMLIHSVDSQRLLAAVNADREASGDNPLPIPVLLEVNTSGEAAKHGLAPEEVDPMIASAARYGHVRIRGLMTMAALEGGDAMASRNFASLRELRDRLKRNAPNNVTLDELSMGMSDDFEIGIREGATIVRIGSLLWE